jgi:hypothetical protein
MSLSPAHPHDRARERLLTLTPASSDDAFVEAVAAMIVTERGEPFMCAVRWDADSGPCPVVVHRWAMGRHAGVFDAPNRQAAFDWLKLALRKNLSVARLSTRGRVDGPWTMLAVERQRAEYRQQMATWRASRANGGDDEIPF